MKLQDMGAISQIYEYFQVEQPRRVERLRNTVKMEHPSISDSAVRTRVVQRLLEGQSQYRRARELLAKPSSEPRWSSPLEQIKARTAILNPMGELTGGNYTAGF